LAFVRRKLKGGREYFELVENRKVNRKVVQRVLQYLGSEEAMLA